MSTEPHLSPHSSRTRPSVSRRLLQWTLQTGLHFALWIVLSGHTEAEFLALGAVVAVGATFIANWLFHGIDDPVYAGPRRGLSWFAGVGLRFVLYIPWLAWEVVLSGLHVSYLALHPKMPIDPSLVEFETSLESERAQVLLAQSITLTPGTVTVDASNGRFVVHCLSEKSREGIEDGRIQRKVGSVFDEPAAARAALREVASLEQELR